MTIGFGKYAIGHNQPVDKLPGRAWLTIAAGTTINLCLGCLYAWSVWLKYLTDESYMLAHGWAGAMTAEQASNPKSMCILVFALLMIPGGKIQDKYGPTVSATIGAIFMGLGMIIAGTHEIIRRYSVGIRNRRRYRHGRRLCRSGARHGQVGWPAPKGVHFGSYGRWLRRRGILCVSADQVDDRKSVPVILLHGTWCRLP